MVRTRCGSLSILGHSLRNKIPFIGNQRKRGGQYGGVGADCRLHPLIHTFIKLNLAHNTVGGQVNAVKKPPLTSLQPRPMGAGEWYELNAQTMQFSRYAGEPFPVNT